MSMRALWAVLFVLAPLAAVAGYGSTYGVTSMGGSGGGTTVGSAVSGGTASRLLFSDGSTQVSTASPVAVTSSLDLTSGTLDVGGACTLDSTLSVAGQATFTRDPASTATSAATVRINPATSAANEVLLSVQDNGTDEFWVDKEGDAQLTGALRVDSTADIRGAISNGGSGTCNGLNAGSACINDAFGTTITTGGTAAVFPLTVQVPAVSAAADPGPMVVYGEDANAWSSVLGNGTSAASSVTPAIQTRGVGTAATLLGFVVIGGVASGADATSATQPVVAVDGRREAGTPATPSGSAITSKPLFGVRNFGTVMFSVNVNGGLGLRTISPTALSGTVNNYAGCTTTPICRIDGGAADRDITGITPGFNSAYDSSQSELFFVCNIGTTNNLVLKHENAGSSAANRFTFNSATDRNVLPRSCRTLIYDRTSQLWRSATGD